MMQTKAIGVAMLIFLGLVFSCGKAHAFPCRSDLSPSNPDSAYVDHGDGTVTDLRTGLMWMQPVLYGSNWSRALARAGSTTFAGYDDWRLPNVKELSTLVEECRHSPSINTNVFPGTPSEGFWSSSPSTKGDAWGDAWLVWFDTGRIWDDYRINGYSIRLVRGGH